MKHYKGKSFVQMHKFNDGLALVVAGNYRSGYIDEQGEYVIQPQFLCASDFHEERAIVSLETSGFGVIDLQGNYIVDTPYYRIADYSNERALAQDYDSNFKYLDKDGNVVTQNFEEAFPFVDGLAVVRYNHKCGCIDVNGNYVISPIYDCIGGQPHYGLYTIGCIINRNFKMGIMDREGNQIIEPKYDEVKPVDAGFLICDDGCYGFADKNGDVISEPLYSEIKPFKYGVAEVILKHKLKGFINDKGGIIVPIIYTNVWPVRHQKYILVEDEKDFRGLYDIYGNLILPVEYVTIGEISDNVLWVSKKDTSWGRMLYGVMDINGRHVIPIADYGFYGFDDFKNGRSKISQPRLIFYIDAYGFLYTTEK